MPTPIARKGQPAPRTKGSSSRPRGGLRRGSSRSCRSRRVAEAAAAAHRTGGGACPHSEDLAPGSHSRYGRHPTHPWPADVTFLIRPRIGWQTAIPGSTANRPTRGSGCHHLSRQCSTAANTAAKATASYRWTTDLERRPSKRSLLDSPGQSAHSYGSVADSNSDNNAVARQADLTH